MNLRYGIIFHYPRQIIKKLLSFIYPIVIKIWPLPKVMSIEQTIKLLVETESSIVRFGDGEFLYLIDKLNLPFQSYNEELARMFKDILGSNESKIFIGLPIGYYSIENLSEKSKLTWRSQIAWIYPRVRKYLDLNKMYANASMTRLYMDYQDKDQSRYYFDLVKKLWRNRHILLIEGEKSRLGVGNDLFENALSIERILAPAQNAFSQYHNLMQVALQHDKSKLVLIALGPAAKPLAFNLAKKGFQTIDIGNIDIEYEWFLRNANEKIPIPGKYTSEAKGGRNVVYINDEIYSQQIIEIVI